MLLPVLFSSRVSPLLLAPIWCLSRLPSTIYTCPASRSCTADRVRRRSTRCTWSFSARRIRRNHALGIVLNAPGQPNQSHLSDFRWPEACEPGRAVSAGGGRFLVTYTKIVAGTDEDPVTQQMARFVHGLAGAACPRSHRVRSSWTRLGKSPSDAGTVYVPRRTRSWRHGGSACGDFRSRSSAA